MAEAIGSGIAGFLGMAVEAVFGVVVALSPLLWLAGGLVVTLLGRASRGRAFGADDETPRPTTTPRVRRLVVASLLTSLAGTLAGIAVVLRVALWQGSDMLFGTMLAGAALLFIAVFVLYAAAILSFLLERRNERPERPVWLVVWAWVLPPAALATFAGLVIIAAGFVSGVPGGD